MSVYQKLSDAWRTQDSLLCVGLDPDMARIPPHLQDQPQPYFEFCRGIIDATAPHVCAFKPQAAHFAAVGRENELAAVIDYIHKSYPQILVLLDAKRGDIGSTATFYAQEAYERFGADAVTLSPYLGYESVAPYLDYADKGIVVLCRTSNADSDWLQNDPRDEEPVYQRVARRAVEWNTQQQCMLVTGATYPRELANIRQIVGDMPLLVPGIGAQGGDLAAVIAHGLDHNKTGLLISSSRNILFAGGDEHYATAAKAAAKDLCDEINVLRSNL
jgi:orotidine-5'-phosphate decarboxylase